MLYIIILLLFIISHECDCKGIHSPFLNHISRDIILYDKEWTNSEIKFRDGISDPEIDHIKINGLIVWHIHICELCDEDVINHDTYSILIDDSLSILREYNVSEPVLENVRYLFEEVIRRGFKLINNGAEGYLNIPLDNLPPNIDGLDFLIGRASQPDAFDTTYYRWRDSVSNIFYDKYRKHSFLFSLGRHWLQMEFHKSTCKYYKNINKVINYNSCNCEFDIYTCRLHK